MSQPLALPQVANLPYFSNLPKTTEGQLFMLADIMGIPRDLVKGGNDKELLAISAVFPYRRLNQAQRIQVMEIIRSLPNKRLASHLIIKVTDIIVQKDWGLWSQTDDELEKKAEFHRIVNGVTNYVFGTSYSAYAIGANVKAAYEARNLPVGSIKRRLAMGSVWVWVIGATIHQASADTLGAVDKELRLRMSKNRGAYY